MANAITPFLMFEGRAEAAIQYYVALFQDAAITRIERYGPGEPGAEGTVRRAEFVLGEQRFYCIDSPVKHGFGFTPAMSIFVDCEDETELQRVFEALATEGEPLMPLDNYGFSRKFGWVNDRFGVSWQLNLP
jgi:predicted 3-demethylubiquinone-9 3-methyltransferase (glyoxalase superfamily)